MLLHQLGYNSTRLLPKKLWTMSTFKLLTPRVPWIPDLFVVYVTLKTTLASMMAGAHLMGLVYVTLMPLESYVRYLQLEMAIVIHSTIQMYLILMGVTGESFCLCCSLHLCME